MSSPPPDDSRPGHFRWTVCGLLFAASTINYIDRQVLGILAPHLQKVIGWNEVQYGYIVSAFQVAYAIGLAAFGRFIDRSGPPRRLCPGQSCLWSVAAMAHAAARSALGTFGIGPVCPGPGGIRKLSLGDQSRGRMVPEEGTGAGHGHLQRRDQCRSRLAPAVVPWITIRFRLARRGSWPRARIGFIWLVFWIALYEVPERKKNIRPRELRPRPLRSPRPAVRADPLAPLSAPPDLGDCRRQVSHRPDLAVSSLLAGEISQCQVRLTLTRRGTAAHRRLSHHRYRKRGGAAGLFSALIKRGWTVNRSRKSVMLVCALCVVPVSPGVGNLSSSLGSGPHYQPGGGGAPSLVGEHLHLRFGYVSQASRGLGDRGRGERPAPSGNHLFRPPRATP